MFLAWKHRVANGGANMVFAVYTCYTSKQTIMQFWLRGGSVNFKQLGCMFSYKSMAPKHWIKLYTVFALLIDKFLSWELNL